MKKITALFSFILFSLCMVSNLQAEVSTGRLAPDFRLEDTHGQSHALSDFLGRYVVLEWTNYECPFVKKHYSGGNMQSLQKELTGEGVVWLSIGSSAEGNQGYFSADEWNKRASEKNASPTAILLDPYGEVGRMYEAKTTPHMFVINPDGVLIYAGAIDSVASPDPADIEGATNYVRQAVHEAMAGKPVSVPATKSYGCSVKY
ncbi:MAG: thioredoxin family protein [Candidatus Omnitrophica bacterium]|nr:thioredoxin family protein [Candidatus Omnitrophota bacterium]